MVNLVKKFYVILTSNVYDVCVCVCVCAYVCMYVYMYVCVCVCCSFALFRAIEHI